MLSPPPDRGGVSSFLKDLQKMAPGDTPSSATVRVPVVRSEPAPKAAPATPAHPTPTPPSAASPAAPTSAVPRTLLLVDDEDDVRRFLAAIFTEGGYRVVEAADPEAAVKKGGKLAKEQTPFVLVTDLGMPASGGTSFHGGFEVVKRLWKMNHRPPVLMMTESLSQALQLRARQMGIRAFVFKPGLSKLNPGQFEADLKAFGAKILADILPRLAASSAAPRPKPARPEAAAPARPEAAPGEGERSRDFTFLQRRLAELRQPGNANQIAVLVMKVAREYFERAILFLVKNEEARGLGGFGAAPKDENLGLLVRSVVIPLGEPSPFLDVVQSGRPLVGAPPPGKWNSHLMGKIGRFQSRQVALLPLVTHRETIAVLFGDNPETGEELGRLDALEVFIHQAGIALENAFLQKKLQALEQRA
jgi:CheY-like chemotaxis protein